MRKLRKGATHFNRLHNLLTTARNYLKLGLCGSWFKGYVGFGVKLKWVLKTNPFIRIVVQRVEGVLSGGSIINPSDKWSKGNEFGSGP
eukprot:1555559-Amphidinium_carterae.1